MPAGGGSSQQIYQSKQKKTPAQIAAITKASGEAGRAARRKWEAANTQGLSRAPTNRSGGSGGSGAVGAPVSTLASLPQTPELAALIAQGIIREGMPPEQALAILAISGQASKVPIDIAALKAMVEGNYQKYTGDIAGAGADWMKQIMGQNMPTDPAMAALYAQDPLFTGYAGSLAQMDETADTNLATDLAWFDKQQAAYGDYYNSLLAGASAGTLLPAAGGGGGGGGGGGRGGGGYGGGGGGGGDDWSDPNTKVTETENLRNVDETVSNALFPEFYQHLVEQAPNSEMAAILNDFAIEGKDPSGVLEVMRQAGNENQDVLDIAADKEASNTLWDVGLGAAANRELTSYQGLSGFDPKSGELPDMTAFGPTDEEGNPIQIGDLELLSQFPRLQQLANVAYDPGETRRTAYESLFDRRRIQELLGMVPKRPEEVPEAPPPSATSSAAYNPLSSVRDAGYGSMVDTNTGLPHAPTYEEIRTGQYTNPNNLPLDPNTGMPVGFPTGEAGDNTVANRVGQIFSPRTTDGQGRPLSGPELQAQIDRELHTAGGAFNMIEDYDPKDPLKNVRTMLSMGSEGRSNIEPYLESGAFQQMPPGQQAAVETFLQQRGIDTPGGTAEDYAARRNNRGSGPSRAEAETGGLQGLAGGWLDRLNRQRNKQQLIGAAMANPAMFNTLMHMQPEEGEDRIDFAPEDINRAFAGSAVVNGRPRWDVKEELRGWEPTDEEMERAETVDPDTGKSYWLSSEIGNRYWQEPEDPEVVQRSQSILDAIEWGMPIAIEADPYKNFAAWKDLSRMTGTETNNAATTINTRNPDVATELQGFDYNADPLNTGDFDPILDILPEEGFLPSSKLADSGAGSGGNRPQIRSIDRGSRIPTKVQPKTDKGINALLAALRRQSSTPATPRTAVKKPVIKKPTGSKPRKVGGRVRASAS